MPSDTQSTVDVDSLTFPITFRGWWWDGDQCTVQDPWLTFTVKVHSDEAGDFRDLQAEDMPALLAALGLNDA